jgi:lipopolysaccharide transport system permease protein
MKHHAVDPLELIRTLMHNIDLLWELTKRDFVARYKGSFLGLAWSLVTPLFMLAIYTFVFSVAFKAKWGAAENDQVNFATVLFSGLIVHALFAECLIRAPTLIAMNANYVKKVVFPLEILPLMTMGSALGNFVVSLIVLVVFCMLSGTPLHPAGLLLPILLLPLVLMTLGFSWFLTSLGVYLRDFAQVIGMLTSVALFLAPIFYPISALPPIYQSLMMLNPITLPVLQVRDALLWGVPLNWAAWVVSLFVGLGVFYLGLAWFQKTRRGFADVL